MTAETPPTRDTILVVEDEAIVAADLEQRLRRLGYATLGPAASGEEALALARAQPVNLALCDIRLQGEMDGITTAEVLRQELRLPVIFLTAHADQATLTRAQITEPFGYLLKPFDERLLHITISMAIHKHRAEVERRRLTAQLEHALAEIQTLSGLLPICASCKKIEDESGTWDRVESYISKRTSASFTHTLCPECLHQLYPEMADSILKKLTSPSAVASAEPSH